MNSRSTMNVSVTPELESFVDRLVASGRYQTSSEVFREALRLLEQHESRRLLEKLLLQGLSDAEARQLPDGVHERAAAVIRAKVQEGLDAAARGDVFAGNEVFAEIRERSRQRNSAAEE